MAKTVKTAHPGSIIIREYKTGEYLYYRAYKQRKWKSTGLKNTKSNIKTVEKILQSEYQKFLSKTHQIEYKELQPTINDVFNQYLEKIRSVRSKSTIREYTNSFTQIISYNYDLKEKTRYRNREITQIEQDIITFIDRNRSNIKPVTINKHLRHLQVFVNYIQEEYNQGHINYYKKYRLEEEEKEIVPYTKEEALSIIDAAKKQDEVLYLLLMLFYLTGGRINEWINAYFVDSPYSVDLDKRIIKFRNKIKKHSYQTIPITDEVYIVLLRLKELEQNRSKYKDKVIPYSPNSKSNLIARITKIEKELGIKKKGRSTHGFRRLLATELFKNEVPFDVIKDVMRHSSIDTTIKAYRKIDKQRIADALNKIER